MTASPRILHIPVASGTRCHLCGASTVKDPHIGIDIQNDAAGTDSWSKGHRTFIQMCRPCVVAISDAIMPMPASENHRSPDSPIHAFLPGRIVNILSHYYPSATTLRQLFAETSIADLRSHPGIVNTSIHQITRALLRVGLSLS